VRVTGVVRPTWPRRLDLRRALTHDFPLKAAALVIAMLFWVGYTQQIGPRDVTVAFDGRVPVERPSVPSGFVLRAQLGDVGVRLAGPEDQVASIGLADLHATIDLTGIDVSRPEPYDAKVDVTVANDAVKVVDWSPATISVRLERITSRTVAVQAKLANEPPKGTQAGLTSVTPKEVQITGPESTVAQVAAVFATVRFGDVASDLSDSAPAVPVDANGTAVEGLQVEPGVVRVNVPVLPTATTKTVPILWNVRGSVANGYWISRMATDPIVVTISGEQSLITPIERLETVPIDVTGLSATRTVRVSLNLPEGVSLVTPVDANVTITIVALAGTRPFYAAIQIANLSVGLDAGVDTGSATVIVAGPQPTLVSLTADQVTASVDAAGRGPGTYVVDVNIRVPSGVTIQSVQPQRVTLTIRGR
jgi:YbbR domain-containing protein